MIEELAAHILGVDVDERVAAIGGVECLEAEDDEQV